MDPAAFPGVASFWAQTDAVGRAAAVVLLLMSLATWYLLLVKTLQVWQVRRQTAPVVRAFWSAPTLDEAVTQAQRVAPANPYSVLAAELASGLRRRAGEAPLLLALDPREHAASLLRASLQRASRRLGAGLGVLASVGATAPFVGLFGTVWGIYHALVAIGFTGQATLDKVAGPVGEALIMTALGIAVAVPAVLAYNFLLRANRDIVRGLDGFAQDLLACTVRPAQAPAADAPMPARACAADARGSS